MKPEEKKKRKGEDAKRLLNDPVLKEALSTLRNTCFNNIESSSHDQQGQREDLYYMLRCISAFERQLKQYIQEGTVSVYNSNVNRLIR